MYNPISDIQTIRSAAKKTNHILSTGFMRHSNPVNACPLYSSIAD
jgi:hypothetical protein